MFSLPDSTTIAGVGIFLSNVSPSWSMVILVIGVMLLFPLGSLIRNSKVVEAIIKYFESHNEMVSTVKEIRSTQIDSNTERKKQGESISSIDARLTLVERDLQELKERGQI